MGPIVTFTTDFGLSDPFVAALKGVVLSICPDARLVDVTHAVAPQDVLGGALALMQAAPYFPPRTVHVAVVDPGVGTARAALALRADGRIFVGPDNGVLTLAAPRPDACRRIENPRVCRPDPAPTFHGRDVFAPAAGHLASGFSLDDLGPPCEPRRIAWPARPEVLGADRFGNLLTSLRADEIPGGAVVEVEGFGAAPLQRTYADVDPGRPVAYVGSAGLIEVGVRGGSAAAALGAAVRGRSVTVR